VGEETDKKRIDRELLELLNELRVALPGVQVLFAFLLAVPFQQGFRRVTSYQRAVYFITLCLALLATATLIAPSALHRLNFRMGDKRTIVMMSNRLTIAGLALIALAMVGVMVLISDVLFGLTASIFAGSLAALVFGVLWGALPLREHRQALAGRRELDGHQDSRTPATPRAG
jgi:hypothetical protein